MPRAHLIRLWIGQLFSAVGDQLHQVALVWIAVEAVGASAGLVVAAGTAARLAFGLTAGVYADRWDRQYAMIGADLGRAAGVATLAVAGGLGSISLVHLALVAALLGVLDSLFAPALQASLPALVPERGSLQRANAFLNVNHRLARVLGPGLTGVLLAFLPIEQFFAIDAATFLASALSILAIGRGVAWKPTRTDSRPPSAWGEIRGTFREVRGHPVLAWGIALIGVWNVGSAAAMILGLPLFAKDVLNAGPAAYGALIAAYGVGNVASNLAIAARPPRNLERTLFLGGAIFGVGMLGVAAAPSLFAALAIIPLAAIGGPMADLVVLLIIQTHFPPDRIGKLYSVRILVSHASRGVGLIAAAPLFGLVSVRAGIAVGAGLVLAMSMVALLRFVGSGERPGSR